MSKPEWRDSPDTANWLAKDASGEWCWFVNKPYDGCYHWMPSPEPVDGDSFFDAGLHLNNDDEWTESLEPRP